MQKIKELLELARQSLALANGTTHPETKTALLDLAADYDQQAEERRKSITQAIFPNDKKIG